MKWTFRQLTQYGTLENHQSYNEQQVHLKESFDLKHTIMQYNYETFGYLQHRLYKVGNEPTVQTKLIKTYFCRRFPVNIRRQKKEKAGVLTQRKH